MRKLVAVAVILLSGACAYAQTHPFQASVTPDIAIHDQDVMIEGLTLSIWGQNPQKALSLGIANGSTGDSSGFSWGFLLNYADNYKGVHWAAVNYTTGDFLGWQGACINYTGGFAKGLQTGWVNYAESFKGLQFGLVNFAKTTETGVQIGIINIIQETQTWFTEFPDAVAPGMVLVNWRF